MSDAAMEVEEEDFGEFESLPYLSILTGRSCPSGDEQLWSDEENDGEDVGGDSDAESSGAASDLAMMLQGSPTGARVSVERTPVEAGWGSDALWFSSTGSDGADDSRDVDAGTHPAREWPMGVTPKTRLARRTYCQNPLGWRFYLLSGILSFTSGH
jgi:hypothetical protein